jgi:hypothetical protein
MTNGAQSAGPAAAQAAIANSLTGSTGDSNAYQTDSLESMKEDDEDEESEMEQVAKSIGVMKMDNNKTIFASEAHWYAILGEVCCWWLLSLDIANGGRYLRSRTTFTSIRNNMMSNSSGIGPLERTMSLQAPLSCSVPRNRPPGKNCCLSFPPNRLPTSWYQDISTRTTPEYISYMVPHSKSSTISTGPIRAKLRSFGLV